MQSSAKVNLSIVILARNEETNLPECLKTCDFAKEIILIDDNSTDKTVEIAKSFGAKVFSRPLAGDWGKQQTFAIQQATGSWIFLLDCDERITEELKLSIIQKVDKNELFSYEVQRHNKFYNFKIDHGSLRPDWVPRLFPNDGVSVVGRVHPKIQFKYPLKKLTGKLLHYTYSSMDQYYSKLNQYAGLCAQKYYENGKKIYFFRDILLRPCWSAFKVYFINRGFLDGKMGVIFAMNQYIYTAQKYIRSWVLSKTNGKHL